MLPNVEILCQTKVDFVNSTFIVLSLYVVCMVVCNGNDEKVCYALALIRTYKETSKLIAYISMKL